MTELDASTEGRDAAALALLASLPDETLAELLELVVAGRAVQAVRLAHQASGPEHALTAAIHAIGLF